MHFGKYRVAQKCKFIIKVKSRWDIIYCHQIWRDYYPFPVAPTFIATRIEPLLFLGNLIWGHNLGSKPFLSHILIFFNWHSSTLANAQSLSTTSNMDHQLLCQKSCQKFLVMKTKKTWCFQKNSLFWHFNSRFVLKTTETPVFMFSLLRFFD